jgi:hypothetical protein
VDRTPELKLFGLPLLVWPGRVAKMSKLLVGRFNRIEPGLGRVKNADVGRTVLRIHSGTSDWFKATLAA